MRYIRQILMLPLLLSVVGCTTKLQSGTFEIDITYQKASGVLYEVIPQTNDYYYLCAAVSVDDYNKMGDEGVIDSIDALAKDVYDMVKEYYEYENTPVPSFLSLLENGAIYGEESGLQAETNYYLCIICYNKHNKPMKFVDKKAFRTLDALESTVTFDVKTQGHNACITPSNNETYFWNIISKEDMDRRYLGMPGYYYSELVENYERYGFIKAVLSEGVDTARVLQYVNMDIRDTAYLVMAAYYNETNSQVSAYELVYQDNDTLTCRHLSSAWDVNSTDAVEQKALRLFRKNAVRPRL